MQIFAVIDLGSNSARLYAWQIDGDNQPVQVIKQKAMVRLSEKMGEDKQLQEAAIERTIETLKAFKQALAPYGEAVTLRAFATAATRQAANQKDFLRRVKKATDIELEVIPGTREATLDYQGVINTLPVQNALIMDTGGASTELILVQNAKMQHVVSIPFGSVNLSERFLNRDVISAPEYFTMATAINRILNGIWWLKKAQNLPIIALGGSNRTLAKIQRRKDLVTNFEDIHGYRMATSDVNAIFTSVLAKNLEERKAIAGLAKERADIIVAGLMPLVTMIQYLDSDRLVFSQNGLREGALYEFLNQSAMAPA